MNAVLSRRVAAPFALALLAAMSLAVSANPAAAQSRREMQMMADLRIVQEQNQQLQIALAQLTDAITKINGRFDEQANLTRKSFADQKLVVDQFASDLRVVRERVDDTNVRISSLSQEIEGLRVAIPQPAPSFPDPATSPESNAPAGSPQAGSDPAGQAAAPPPAALGVSPQRLYSTAEADYFAGQWTLCVTGFDTYLRTFPRSELAGNAQFYIGECHANDRKFTEAVEAYDRVIANYPRAERAPDSYYKRGLALEQLKQLDRARESYEAAVQQFPESAPARLAKQALDRVNRSKPPR